MALILGFVHRLHYVSIPWLVCMSQAMSYYRDELHCCDFFIFRMFLKALKEANAVPRMTENRHVIRLPHRVHNRI